MELRRQGSSNFVGSSSLIGLHRAVAMAAAMMTSIASAIAAATAQCRLRPSPRIVTSAHRNRTFFPLMNGLLVRIIQAELR